MLHAETHQTRLRLTDLPAPRRPGLDLPGDAHQPVSPPRCLTCGTRADVRQAAALERHGWTFSFGLVVIDDTPVQGWRCDACSARVQGEVRHVAATPAS